jgi:OOP family OmpA-OmpF porin
LPTEGAKTNMRMQSKFSIGVLGIALVSVVRAQEVSMTVQLTAPLSSGSVHKGDSITAQVATPDAYRGDTIQGRVTQVNGARGMFEFTVDTLRHTSGVDVKVSAKIQGVSNSQGQSGVDDQGRTVNASNIAAKPPSQTRAVSRLGGLVGGRIGQASSEAPPENSAGSPAAIQVAAPGGVQLAAGATMVLSIASTGNVALSSLAPNFSSGSATPSGGSAVPASNAPTASSSSMAASQSSGATAGTAAGVAGGQPEMKSNKIEFVAGERTVFFEDFSDWVDGEPPPHWKVRNGTVELRMGGGIRELYSEKGVDLTSGIVVIPTNFTFELDWTGQGEMSWQLFDKKNDRMFALVVRGEPDGKTANIAVEGPAGRLGDGGIDAGDLSKTVHFSLWAQQGRVRAYLNGQRLVDANQVEFGPMDHILTHIGGYRPNSIRQVRIAESAPDFSTVINASGKYVTHGINFDTDSDRLKPESGAVLKQVAAGLARNPNLKLEIDGYTDSVGDAGHNLDLSKRRAQAVQSVLVAQFGIDPARLASNGFGPAQPIGSNDTPDGRAANRRVEFLKK